MKIEFKFTDESQQPTMVQMADAMPRIGEGVQISKALWKVDNVVHYVTESGSYDRTTIFLKKQDA